MKQIVVRSEGLFSYEPVHVKTSKGNQCKCDLDHCSPCDGIGASYMTEKVCAKCNGIVPKGKIACFNKWHGYSGWDEWNEELSEVDDER